VQADKHGVREAFRLDNAQRVSSNPKIGEALQICQLLVTDEDRDSVAQYVIRSAGG